MAMISWARVNGEVLLSRGEGQAGSGQGAGDRKSGARGLFRAAMCRHSRATRRGGGEWNGNAPRRRVREGRGLARQRWRRVSCEGLHRAKQRWSDAGQGSGIAGPRFPGLR